MALDRWIALIFVAFCCAYGYAAFFTMDQLLPPFMQRNPVWPSTFPKVLAVSGALVGLIIALGLESRAAGRAPSNSSSEFDLSKLMEYKIGQASALIGLMIVFALMLRPVGFLASTTLFLFFGAAILGERRWLIMLVVGAAASFSVWYLVEEVLGIFLRPWPFFLG
ncbi:MAG: tripartite tricarboxylate transporter TctB family protein [Pseudomonadota bacterium]